MKKCFLFRVFHSILDGTFLHKVNERTFNLHSVKNRKAKALIEEIEEYNRLSQKYGSILDNMPENSSNRKKSNIVWTCWLQGEENAPPLIKACFEAMRKKLPDKELIIITERNIDTYIKLPSYIKEKKKRGIITPTHYSDIIRTALLCEHGGLWCDSTVFITSHDLPDYVTKLPLFVFKEVDLSRSNDAPIIASSWFIAAESHNPIMQATLRLLYAYWKKEQLLTHYYVFHMFFAMAARRYYDLWEDIPTYNNISPHILMFEMDKKYSQKRWEQIMKMSDIHKLTRHSYPTDFHGTNYEHILLEYEQNE